MMVNKRREYKRLTGVQPAMSRVLVIEVVLPVDEVVNIENMLTDAQSVGAAWVVEDFICDMSVVEAEKVLASRQVFWAY